MMTQAFFSRMQVGVSARFSGIVQPHANRRLRSKK